MTIVSYNPILLPVSHEKPLAVRVTAPEMGDLLPVIVFSHGNHYSKDDYLPLTEYWAAHGFIVIQPTHQDAVVGGLAPTDPRQANVWRTRINEMKLVLSDFDTIEAAVPALRGRLDRTRIMVAGHSFGGHTVQALGGARVRDPDSKAWLDFQDRRVKAVLILAGPGSGGEALTPDWARRAPYLDVDWTTMTTPTLVIAGAEDDSTMTIRGPNWHQDPYRMSPAGGKCLVVLKGAKHYMGGILGPHRTEVTDENPGLVTAVQKMSTTYFYSIAEADVSSWLRYRAALDADREIVEDASCK